MVEKYTRYERMKFMKRKRFFAICLSAVMIMESFAHGNIHVTAASVERGKPVVAADTHDIDVNGIENLAKSESGTEKNGLDVQEEKETITVKDIKDLQSEHDYASNMDKTWVYSVGNAAELKVTFSSDTEVENGSDYIYIYDIYDNQIGRYTNVSLAGKTVTVPYGTVKIRLTSDDSNTAYGFAVDSIVAMTGISVKSNPSNVSYLVGQKPNYEGFMLQGNYDDGTVSDIPDGYIFGEIDNNVSGEKIVDVTYRNLKTSFSVTYSEPSIVKIEIVSKPEKLEYSYGQKLNLDGIVIHATDSDGNIYDVSDGYEVLGFDSSVLGTQTITIQYKDFTAEFDISVKYPFTYTVSQDGIMITGLTDTTVTDLYIPEEIDGKNIVGVSSNAFMNKSGLVSVSLPETINDIGEYAFSGCGNLKSINIPDGVTKIKNNTFYNCKSLGNIALPNNLTEIGSHAFYQCESITAVKFPDGLTSIGQYAYKGCTGITNIRVPESVTGIGAGAFQGVPLTEISIPFVGDSRGSSYGVQSVFGYIFGYTSSYESGMTQQYFNVSSSATSNDKRYFYIPQTLKKVTVTDAGKIPNYAFYNCSNLSDIFINDEITDIGSYAFYNCKNINGINIPTGITRIRKGAFEKCSSLEKVTMPDNVTEIEDYAFSSCNNINNVTIPDKVTRIGEYAFRNCEKITEAEFPDGLTSIGQYAYKGCTGITNIRVPESVTSIDAGAFQGVPLTEISIPFVGASRGTSYGVQSVFGYIFGYTSYYESGIRQQNYYTDSDLKTTDCRYFYIPNTLKKVTVTDANQIPAYAFNNCLNLIYICINEGIETIGKRAFYQCIYLDELYLPGSLTSIGENALYNCGDIEIYTGKGTIGYEYALKNDINVRTAKSIVLDKSSEVLYKGDECILNPVVTMFDGNIDENAEITWTTSDSRVVTVTDGTVKVAGPGTATVTASCEDKSAECDFTVYYLLESVSIYDENIWVDLGTSKIVHLSFTPYNTTDDKTIKWTSSNENVASVGGFGVPGSNIGEVTAHSKGTATITATAFNGMTATVNVTVLVPVTSVELSKQSLVLDKGTEETLSATVLPENTTDTYTWESSDNSVVTVDSNGKISAVGTGTATVSVVTSRGETASCDVRVKIPSTAIAISESVKNIFIDDTVKLSAVLTPAESTELINWESDNTDVVKVNDRGELEVISAGTATITAMSESGFSDECIVTVENNISNTSVTLESVDFEYTGKEIKPSVVVKYGTRTLKDGTDYTIKYQNNVNIGTGTITILGQERYSGEKQVSINITRRELKDSDIDIDLSSEKYTGRAITKSVTVSANDATLQLNSDYEIVYDNNINAGKASVTIKGIGKYCGAVTKYFTIDKVEQEVDVTISENNIKINNTAAISAGGVGEVTYKINKSSIASIDENGIVTAKKTGTAVITVTVSGNGNYTPFVKDINITVYCNHEGTPEVRIPYKASTCTNNGATEETACSICGNVLKKSIVIRATGHTWANVYTVDKAATCMETGSMSVHCTICNSVRENSAVTIEKTDHSYSPQITEATCTANGYTFHVCSMCGHSYNDNDTNAYGHDFALTVSKATTKKNGSILNKCKRCGHADSAVIYYPEKVSLSVVKIGYNGNVIHPKVIVKGKDGKIIDASNYTVKYSKGCKKIGKYKATVNFKNNYSGTVTKSFQIIKGKQKFNVSDKTLVLGSSGKSLGIKKQKGAGKLLYSSSNSKVAGVSGAGKIVPKSIGTAKIRVTSNANSNYKKASAVINVTVVPKAAKITSAVCKDGGKMLVKWSKGRSNSGYQIRYSDNKGMSEAKTVTVNKANVTSKTISGLKTGKEYYVQVRTYKTVNGKKICSQWSNSKSVIIKNKNANQAGFVNNFDKFVNELIQYGGRNKYGEPVINYTNNDILYSIRYDSKKNALQFSTLYTQDYALTSEIMYLYRNNLSVVTIEYSTLYVDSGKEYKAKATLSTGAVTSNMKLRYSSSTNADAEELADLFTEMSFLGWEILLMKESSFTLRELGFTSYDA